MSPHIHMLPLSGKLRGVWGWVQACLTPSLRAPAQRHRHHSDKHTPTLTRSAPHCNNTHTNMHLKVHIFTCDAPRTLVVSARRIHTYTSVHGCISAPVWLQVCTAHASTRLQLCLQKTNPADELRDCGQMPVCYIWIYTHYVQFFKAYKTCISYARKLPYQQESVSQQIELWL